jgi:hypothetical protein
VPEAGDVIAFGAARASEEVVIIFFFGRVLPGVRAEADFTGCLAYYTLSRDRLSRAGLVACLFVIV